MKSDLPITSCFIVTLEITCWSFSIGGEHYTGYLTGYTKEGGYTRKEVQFVMSAKQALALNKKDNSRGRSLWHPGELATRFDTSEELERQAIKIFRFYYPDALVLNVGSFAVGDPQRILFCVEDRKLADPNPAQFMHSTNAMVEEWEKVGGYEGNEKRCTKLFHSYRALLKEFQEASLKKLVDSDVALSIRESFKQRIVEEATRREITSMRLLLWSRKYFRGNSVIQSARIEHLLAKYYEGFGGGALVATWSNICGWNEEISDEET